MKYEVIISGLEEVKEFLSTLAEKDSKRIFMKILRRLATEYKKFIQRQYLSGQYLSARTGLTRDSMISYKSRKFLDAYMIASRIQYRGTGILKNITGLANIYEHPGGVDIATTNKRFMSWRNPQGIQVFSRRPMHRQSRPFMSDSAKSFDFNGRLKEITDKTMAEEVEKLERKLLNAS